MKEKKTMVLEYHPDQDAGQITFIWEENPGYNPGWKKLGIFHGTMMEGLKELDRRIELYNKCPFYEIKCLN